MTSLTTFPLFPQLPKELRLQIWKEAIAPRIIKLKPDLAPLDFRNQNQFLYLVGGLGPLRHFTLDELNRPEEPYYTVHLMPHKFSSPLLLSTSSESRAIALESGYQVWKMYDQKGGVRNVMWNPEIDVVLVRKHGLATPAMDVFVKQYPEQARQARRVGAMSSVWQLDLNPRRALEVVGPLLRMAAVEEFVVCVDVKYERDLVEQAKLWERESGWRGRYGWLVPGDVMECIFVCCQGVWGRGDEELERELADWKMPRVRVVWNEEGLLGDEDLDLKLRTWPCEALGMPSVAASSKPNRLNGFFKEVTKLGFRRKKSN